MSGGVETLDRIIDVLLWHDQPSASLLRQFNTTLLAVVWSACLGIEPPWDVVDWGTGKRREEEELKALGRRLYDELTAPAAAGERLQLLQWLGRGMARGAQLQQAPATDNTWMVMGLLSNLLDIHAGIVNATQFAYAVTYVAGCAAEGREPDQDLAAKVYAEGPEKGALVFVGLLGWLYDELKVVPQDARAAVAAWCARRGGRP